jgi:hypothetical protein
VLQRKYHKLSNIKSRNLFCKVLEAKESKLMGSAESVSGRFPSSFIDGGGNRERDEREVQTLPPRPHWD